MKRLIIFGFVLCASIVLGQDRLNQSLTNDVLLTDYGLRFGVCDNFWESSNKQAMIERTELIADQPLTWYFRNTASNASSSVVFLGMSNSFAFELKTTKGAPLSKTEMGKAMSAGPVSLTNPRDNKFVRREGEGFSPFPKLTELFNFPSNGIYVFELRYWTWNNKDKFSLSAPVRLKVIKQNFTNQCIADERSWKKN